MHRRAFDPEVQSPNLSQRQLSHGGGCVWRGALIGADLTCLEVGYPPGVAPLRSSFRSTIDGLLPVDLYSVLL